MGGNFNGFSCRWGYELEEVFSISFIIQVLDKGQGYLFDKNKVRVQIEWTQSLLLFQSTYHKYDDLVRMQYHQMKKDIDSLKLENNLLERRLDIIDGSEEFNDFDG